MYLQDTFNRADAGSWGTASDGSGSWSTIDAGSGYGWSITSNAGRLTGNWDGQRGTYIPLSTHSAVKITLLVTTSGQFELSGGRAEAIFIAVRKPTTGQNGSNSYGIKIWGDNSGSLGLQIIDSGTTKASTSFAAVNSTQYNIEIDINADNHMDVYVYTGAKPGTPTLSFTNGGSPYTPTASGSNFGLEYAPNQSTTGTVIFDDLAVDTPSTNVTVSSSVVAASFSIPAPTVTAVQNATISPSALSLSFSLPAASVSGGAAVSPSVLSATFSLPAPDIQIPDALVTPSAVGATFSIPSPTIHTDYLLTVSPLSALFSFPSPSVSTVQNTTVLISPLSAVFTLPTLARAGGLWDNRTRGSASWTNRDRGDSTWTNTPRAAL